MKIEPGGVVSHYHLIEPLGAGGMGEVWLARDPRLERDVAIKFLSVGSEAESLARKRFLREARAAASLTHPNVCTVHEVGEQGDLIFIVMQRVEGESLAQRIERQGPLPPSKVVSIGVQVTDALAVAHGASIVHRDIKPHNIMINSRGHATVLDFGLAKFTTADDAVSALTMTNEVPGTVPYMSPEQLQGERIDARTDLFSAGVVLYEAVIGDRPFAGHSVAQVITAILTRDAPSLDEIDVRAPGLGAIVRRALARERRDRYQTAEEMMEDLRRLERTLPEDIDQQLIATQRGVPVTTPQRNVGSVSRTRRLSGAGARRRDGSIASLAVLPFESASAGPDVELLGEGITESLIADLSRLPNLRVMARGTVFRYKGRETDQRVVGEELGVGAVLSGRVRLMGEKFLIRAELVDVEDGSVLWTDQYVRSQSDILDLQQELATEIASRLRPTLSSSDRRRVAVPKTSDAEAYQSYLRGLHFLNRRDTVSMRTATEAFHDAIELDPVFAAPYCGLAEVYIYFGFLEMREPLEVFPLARAAADKALELDLDYAEAHAALGWMKVTHEWDWKGAEEELETAVRLNPNCAVAHHWHGLLQSYTGRFDDALEKMLIAQRLDPLAPIINTTLGLTAYHRGDFETAVRLYEKVADVAPGFLPLHLYRGLALDAAGRFEESIEMLQKGLAIVPDEPLLLAELGHALGAMGNRDEAEAMFSRLVERRSERYTSAYGIAVVAAGMGDAEGALSWLDRALEERSAWLCTIQVDARWQPLRSDPRFVEHVTRLAFPS